MAIQALQTYQTPEFVIPAKEYPNLWLLDLVINGRGGKLEEATAYINVCPCNSATGEINLGAQQDVSIPILEYLMIPMEDGSYNPLAIAMGAVEQAVPWVLKEMIKKQLRLDTPPVELVEPIPEQII